MTLIHGGNLGLASREFGIPLPDWVDLSTGISPCSWPVPALPQAVWQRLPEEDDDLLASAADYYRCPPDTLLAVPGSQYAIRQLPGLLAATNVALPLWGYREHHHAWQLAGHSAVSYRDIGHLHQLVNAGTVTHAVVINPNNPTTELIDRPVLENLAGLLTRHGGLLVVDEAFMDPHPQHSLIPQRPSAVVVLRSIGKFFGLAGVRLGFVVADPALIQQLGSAMNPWSVSHPARWIGSRALADHTWQQLQRQRLELYSRQWLAAVQALLPDLPWQCAAHFISAELDWQLAQRLYRAAAQRGLLLRLIGPHARRGLLRLGLPGAPQHQRALDILQSLKDDLE